MSDRPIIDVPKGWSKAALERYLKEREVAQFRFIDPHSPARQTRPVEQNNRYNPRKWRG